MSTTVITLLKILLHGDAHIDEIVKYTNLDVNSIERKILILNDYLEANGISKVKKINNIYILENNGEEFSDFFSRLNIISSEQRQKIYCVRLLIKGYINLEKERKRIGVSRTTAIKDFKIVKENLLKNNILLESKNSKGIFLKESNEKKVTEILFEDILRLFIDRDFLCMQRKELLEEIDILDEQIYLEIYKEITEMFKIKKSIFVYYSIYAMALIEKHKGYLDCDMKNLDKTDEFKKILKKIKTASFSKDISEELTKAIASIITKIKMYQFLDYPIKFYFDKFLNEIKSKFKMDTFELERLKKSICIYFMIGYLDKKYEVLWVRKEPHSLKCKKLAAIIEKVLKDIGLEMMYSDVLRLSGAVSKFFMKEIFIDGFKVISVSRNIDEEYNQRVIECIEKIYPGLKFESQSFLEFRFRSKESIQKYDLIISDTESYKVKKLKKVNTLSIREIERCFIEYALDKNFKNIDEL
ncbi:hypothetical protein [Cetobacterium sp.]|uniref:hypothetical protein n=1 Tax=Cetobacterium sp. TaxID=2071632 RepID=UPI003F3FFB19